VGSARGSAWGITLGVASVAAAAIATSQAATGCATHQCDASFTALPPGGTVTSAGDTVIWESAPLAGPWVDFPGAKTLFFGFPAPFAGNQPTVVTAYESADANNPQSNFIQATGVNAEFSTVTPDGLLVTNATCAAYSLRIVAVATVASDGGDAGAVCPQGETTWMMGGFVDPDTWESNAIAAQWVEYPGNTTILLSYDLDAGPDAGRIPIAVDTYVSSGPSPIDGGQGWELASGDEAMVVTLGASHAAVRNGTCKHEWARFVIHFPASDASAVNPE
jgi:hypothetical protein